MVPANKKRSRGEEMQARQAQVDRESMAPPPAKQKRGAPTDRTEAKAKENAKAAKKRGN